MTQDAPLSDTVPADATAALTIVSPTATARATTAHVLGVIGVVLLGILLLGVLGYVALSLGTGALVICALVALVPLTVVLLVVRWIDRWEPEPRLALWFAFLWGAAGSVTIALVIDLGIQIAVYLDGGTVASGDAVAAIVQAPLVEESAKALGLLLIFWVLRRSFDGPVDGVVYAAVIASGFAFVENILYFGSSLLEYGAADLALTFVLRGVLSPFAHVMFTACTGVALGFATRLRSPLTRILLVAAGLVVAVLLHALWNGSSLLAANWIGFYVVVQVPLFALAVAGVVVLRLTERRITRDRLEEYARAGWFSPNEVAMLSTSAGRRVARTWAKQHGTATTAAMRAFIDASTRLAYARQRRLTGRDELRAPVEEGALLDRLTSARAALTTGR